MLLILNNWPQMTTAKFDMSFKQNVVDLSCYDISSLFSAIFMKEINFHMFLFASLGSVVQN